MENWVGVGVKSGSGPNLKVHTWVRSRGQVSRQSRILVQKLGWVRCWGRKSGLGLRLGSWLDLKSRSRVKVRVGFGSQVEVWVGSRIKISGLGQDWVSSLGRGWELGLKSGSWTGHRSRRGLSLGSGSRSGVKVGVGLSGRGRGRGWDLNLEVRCRGQISNHD